ncbi:TIGR02391 family protein [Microbacterium sp. NPDC087591]|uniref:TIGR02391 family protein n=1 Tax=Microbacterium sp. NPDC087591 TaxID=3364192 RepID=UPI00381E7498
MEFIIGISEILAQTDYPGLTNREIGMLLQMVRIDSRPDGYNKRDGLFIALNNKQATQQLGNCVAAFIKNAMSPGRYAREPQRFIQLRDELNEFLIHHGYGINERGQLTRKKQASSLDEGARLAGTLQVELRRRGTHDELFRYCDEEFINRSLFHALTEASKSIPARVRKITGLAGDGGALYNGVFGANKDMPVLYINAYESDSDISEHRGFNNLLMGIHGHFRNPRAHSNRVDASEAMSDFYDAFALFSYVHRRLDRASREPLL